MFFHWTEIYQQTLEVGLTIGLEKAREDFSNLFCRPKTSLFWGGLAFGGNQYWFISPNLHILKNYFLDLIEIIENHYYIQNILYFNILSLFLVLNIGNSGRQWSGQLIVRKLKFIRSTLSNIVLSCLWSLSEDFVTC